MCVGFWLWFKNCIWTHIQKHKHLISSLCTLYIYDYCISQLLPPVALQVSPLFRRSVGRWHFSPTANQHLEHRTLIHLCSMPAEHLAFSTPSSLFTHSMPPSRCRQYQKCHLRCIPSRLWTCSTVDTFQVPGYHDLSVKFIFRHLKARASPHPRQRGRSDRIAMSLTLGVPTSWTQHPYILVTLRTHTFLVSILPFHILTSKPRWHLLGSTVLPLRAIRSLTTVGCLFEAIMP